MSGKLIPILDDSAITHGNLWNNFKYLEEYLRAIAVNAELITGVSLDTDFQQAVADILAADLDSFITNLADSIYNQDDFLSRIVEEDSSTGGEFDGLENNLTFLGNLIDELSDSTTFISAFVDYLQNNAPDFFASLEGDVFKAYFGPALDLLMFATTLQETGVVGVYSLWETGEPDIIGDDATKYVGVTFGLEDNFQSDFNLFVSRDSNFSNIAVHPDDVGAYPLEDPPTAVLRYTYDAFDNTGGNAAGVIAGAFFSSIDGALLLDISKLEWDGQSELYVKLMGTKSNLTYIRVGFDYATHASQVTEGTSVGASTGFATVVVNTQDEWEKIAGKAGEPEKAVGYWDGTKIVWPATMKVILGTIDIQDAGASGGDVFDGGYAYKMPYSIYFDGDNIQILGQGKVTLVKGSDDAVFKSLIQLEEASTGHLETGDKNIIYIVIDEGDFKKGDLIHYALNDGYYTVVDIDVIGNSITVDRAIIEATAGSTITVLINNLKMEGFTFDGRGGVLTGHGSLKTGDNDGGNEGGGFAQLQAVGNSEISCRVVNCKAKNGGAFWLDRCYNIQISNIQFCEAEKFVGVGGMGGGVYGGQLIRGHVHRCHADQGGGFAAVKNGELYVFDCTSGVVGKEAFHVCIDSLIAFNKKLIIDDLDILGDFNITGDADIQGNLNVKNDLDTEGYSSPSGTGRLYAKLGEIRDQGNAVVIEADGHLHPSGASGIKRCAIDVSGSPSTVGTAGDDVAVTEGSGTVVNREFIAEKVWNAQWNDVVDFMELDDKLVSGMCYYITDKGAKLCTKRCQAGVIGLASDTFGFGVGSSPERKLPLSIAGRVLAYVDKCYKAGTVLVNNSKGGLTKARWYEEILFSSRLAAIYQKKEYAKKWGTSKKKIKVNGRHWVKVL